MYTQEAANIVANATSLDTTVQAKDATIAALQGENTQLKARLLTSNIMAFPNLEQLPWAKKTGAGPGGSNVGHGTCDFGIGEGGSKHLLIVPGPGPNGVGYDNFLFGINGLFIPKIGQIVRVRDMVRFKVSDPAKCQTVEAENQRNYPAMVGNMAFCDMIKERAYAYFHFTGGLSPSGWVKLPIPYDPKLVQDWVTWALYTTIDDDAHTITHDQVYINGTVFPIGVTQSMALLDNRSRWDVNFQVGSIGCAKGQLPPPFYVDVERDVELTYPTPSLI